MLAVGNQWHPNLPELPGRVHRRGVPLAGLPRPGRVPRQARADRRRRQLRVRHRLRRRHQRRPSPRCPPAAATGSCPSTCSASPPTCSRTRGPPLPAAVEQKVLDAAARHAGRRRHPLRAARPGPRRAGHPPDHEHPVLDHLGHGDLVARPDVASLDGTTVHFVDGRAEDVDVIVWATGYRPSVPDAARGRDRLARDQPEPVRQRLPPRPRRPVRARHDRDRRQRLAAHQPAGEAGRGRARRPRPWRGAGRRVRAAQAHRRRPRGRPAPRRQPAAQLLPAQRDVPRRSLASCCGSSGRGR